MRVTDHPAFLSSVTDEEWAHALRWAHTLARTPLSEDLAHRLAESYLRRWAALPRRLGCHALADRSVQFALLGGATYAIDEGRIWAFRLSASEEDRLQTVRSVPQLLWRAYQAHRARPHLRPLQGSWPLAWLPTLRSGVNTGLTATHDGHPAVNIRTWIEQTIQEVFAEAAPGQAHWRSWDEAINLETGEPDNPALMDRLQALEDQERQRYRQAMVQVFRTVRRGLPRPVRQVLWGARHRPLLRGELAHWLWHDHGTHVHHRSQALDQHPILLPMALQASGQWPMSFSSPAPRHQVLLQPQLDRGVALSAAIDQGQSWHAAMVAVLQQGKAQAWLLRGGGRWKPYEISHPGMQVTEALARQMQRACRHHLPPVDRMGPFVRGVENWMHAWAGLSQTRRPPSPAGMSQLGFLVYNLGRVLEKRFYERAQPALWLHAHLDGFLKGLPEDWTDPHYDDLIARWASLEDTLDWLCDPLPRMALDTMNELLARLTWRQWNNFVDLAHAIEEELRPQGTIPLRVEPLTWPGARWQPVWDGGDIHIHELRDEQALMEEGRAMHHCVGSAGEPCASGTVREFSVRTAEGVRLSTLEVTWHHGQVSVRQHLAAENQPPSPEAKAAVVRFLAEPAGWNRGPWAPTAEYTRRQAEWQAWRSTQDDYRRQLSARLWNELDRRYPMRWARQPIGSKG
jgi:hypothetical protein